MPFSEAEGVGKTMAGATALAGKKSPHLGSAGFAKINFRNIEKTGIKLGGHQFSYYGFERYGIGYVELATDDMAAAVKRSRYYRCCHRQ